MESKLKNFCFVDYTLDAIIMSYDQSEIRVSDSEYKKAFSINCYSYIGYECLGQWDESIISRVYINDSREFVNMCLKKVMVNYSKNYNPSPAKNFDDFFFEVTVELIDKTLIRIVCKNVDVKEIKFINSKETFS